MVRPNAFSADQQQHWHRQFKLTIAQAVVAGLIFYIMGTMQGSLSANGMRAAPKQHRRDAPHYAAGNLSDGPCNIASAFNSSLVSPATGALDGRFYCAALKTGTDKIYAHHYQYMYSLHMQHLQHQQLKLLEIGLGCGMPYGSGKSVELWRDVLPGAVVSILEYNRACARSFAPTLESWGGRMYIGSKTNVTLLQQVVREVEVSAALYDIIIDDGDHEPDHQLIALRHLWPGLKSGGIYVIEDVFPHFTNPVHANSSLTLIHWIKDMMDLIHCNTPSNNVQRSLTPTFKERCSRATLMEREVASIDCMVDACVIVKVVPPQSSWLQEQGDWVEKQKGWPQMKS